ncbi:MAG: type I-E CRISPR-associated protein Cas6/Cse3/CasE [Peptoniphilus sp.]|nr:type I-E CRISPR-associated protein Cas6/Cse3/CasE [Peptoniphilus sp.]MDD7363430.1 type I-E CRISPR-associated protein Cas6/Cse3/CasE [Bacillota bacterium]MDY6044432.1 type I-E CRISPR-associated protein Cas6/Cse3/CasE [Peptoniphilus sp.]
MYITRVKLDTENGKKMKRASHIAAMHGVIEDSFSEERGLNERSRKLWRIDPIGGELYLLIVSPGKPHPDVLERVGVAGSVRTKDYDPFLRRLEDGMKARFRVKLNPVWSSREGKKSGERGRVVPVSDADQMQYLYDRAERYGFRLNREDYAVVERGNELYRKRGQRDIYLKKAVYEGVLTIADVDRLRKALTEGMGKKKAYGFGMMTLIPMRP